MTMSRFHTHTALSLGRYVLCMALLVFAIVGSASAVAEADLTLGLQTGFLVPTINSLSQMPTDQQRDGQCQATYARIGQQRRMVIHVGLGYFDQSRGYPYVYDGKSYGMNAALDSFAHAALVNIITAPCRGEARACGFHINPSAPASIGGLPVEFLKGPDAQIPIQVIVRIQHGSLSWSHDENLKSVSQQRQVSNQAESMFFDQICQADVAVYMGHSRNGGGPDFNPPVLQRNGHPNYRGYYERTRPGLNRLVQSLRQPGCRPPMLLAISSCLSERHFGIALENAAPGMGLALSGNNELMSYSDILSSGLAVIDSALRLQCARSFQNALYSVGSGGERLQLRNFAGSGPVDRRAATQPLPPLNED